MPSIPQSLLWISLVVLWLFVLVPMLISRRDTVRRTSDVALSTRVLNGRTRSRLLRRSGPAAGHRHDPTWRDEGDDLDEQFADHEPEDYDEAVREAMREAQRPDVRTGTMMMVTADPADADTEPVYLDVDIVEETSGALPVGGVQESLFEESDPGAAAGEPDALAEDAEVIAVEPEAADASASEPAPDEYEYIEDNSEIEADDELPNATTSRAGRRRRSDLSTAAAVSARKYRFRKRVLTVMAAIMALAAVLSFTVSPDLWWACGSAAAGTLLYLAYLRRQTRIEEQVRRRRQQRMARMRAAEEFVAQRGAEFDFDAMPSRARRPGAAVLDIDDEDPTFEHLDEVAYRRRRYDLPRAAGQ